MTAFYYSNYFLEHDTGGHVESKERLISINDFLKTKSIKLAQPDFKPASEDILLLNHPENYIKTVSRISNEGGGWIDADTYISKGSYKAATYAAASVIDAVKSCHDGDFQNAFCAVRPPGHHAEISRGMGFCLFNNIAIGARYLQKINPDAKVFIIDWDAHHGNGTQNAFYEDDTVFFFSTHQYPFYPGTGSKNETGNGSGAGFTVNFPQDAGTSDTDFINIFEKELIPLIEGFKPDMIMISAGFDAHESDPLTSLNISTKGFEHLTRIVKDAAEEVCNGKIVSVLEGGYNLKALAESVYSHIAVLDS